MSKDVGSTFIIEGEVSAELDVIDWNAERSACSCCWLGVNISVIVTLVPDGAILDMSCMAIGWAIGWVGGG